MEKTIREIIKHELNESIISIRAINGLGSVNKVFDIRTENDEYIIRLNEDRGKELEYQKEKWCIENAAKLGIPSPKVLKTGLHGSISFMIQNKISGANGNHCKPEDKAYIWKNLGNYAAKYHQAGRIEVEAVEEHEFHKNWEARLEYNLRELNEQDSLLKKEILNFEEQQSAKKVLSGLKKVQFKTGLVHGDLCPRNIIFDNGTVFLLDWGTAEINVVPHNEIGIVLMSNEADEGEFDLFLEGLGISSAEYQKIKREIEALNLLHRLDKYRWAEGHQVENIKEYEQKVKEALRSCSP
ncbi:MAG: aminoglycoside phosphotransferase family protein [Phaeodactylibacter sp.]|nr:aminoglycoside phosphotransferase family protein [Phaeodactylibacter sp.]MCB9276784.1 aminoglycoside phosphotransferase family protein [Lewinellaceae bacterium]